MKRSARALLALVAASAASCTTPGTGWSRAPDLSVYAAMGNFRDLAREQAVLCGGFSPSRVDMVWAEDFGAREAAVASEMRARHGPDAVEAAADSAEPRVPCDNVPTLKWRHRYERLLRLLEGRFGLA